jgi:hypothetical protein
MTDFVSQLEAELLAAAHRRAKAPRRLPRPRLRPILGVATVAAALVALFALVPRPEPKPERPAASPAAFSLPVASPATRCAVGAEPTGDPAPTAVERHITLLRRMPGGKDRLPRLTELGTWLPVGAFAAGSERSPHGTSKLFVLPTADVRTGPLACGPTTSRGPGACLVFGEPRFTHCFTIAEIEAGRAFTLVDVSSDGARLLGLVPDRAAQVDLSNRGVHARLPVRENAVEDFIQGLTAADRITLKLDPRKPTVLVLNQTTTPGLASQAAMEVRELGVDAAADTSPPTRQETVVQVARPGAEPLARRVAALLGGRVESAAEPPPGLPFEPDVVVRLGTDRMR